MEIGPTNRPEITPERVQQKQSLIKDKLYQAHKDTVEISNSVCCLGLWICQLIGTRTITRTE